MTEVSPPSAARPAVAEAVAGKSSRGPKPDQGKGPQSGILTAGSFDDNLFPGPYRLFAKKLSRDQASGDLPSLFLGGS